MFLGEVLVGAPRNAHRGFVCSFPVSKLGLGCGVLMGGHKRQGPWGTAGSIQGHLRTGGRAGVVSSLWTVISVLEGALLLCLHC